MQAEQELRQLVKEAEEALVTYAGKRTVYNENALRYMVQYAKKVLAGEPLFPVSGSRAYFETDRETELRFLIAHHVMFAFDKGEERHEYYGLKAALHWYLHGEEMTESAKEPVFTFEKEKKDYLMFSEEQWEQIKQRIGQDSPQREQYEIIRKTAERRSTAEVRQQWKAILDGKELSGSEAWYSDTSKGITVQAPEGAAFVSLGFWNTTEDDVQTKFHIRRIRFAEANGKEHLIEPEHGVTLDLEEPTWMSGQPIAVVPGQMYTIHFQVSQQRKLKRGIEMFLRFRDSEGSTISEFRQLYNRKACCPSIFAMGLEAQCNAICYGVTGDEDYAEKAMYELLLFMDDFCQGAAYWQLYGARPEGRDSYGAVQAGRDLCVIAQTYAFIKYADCWTEELRRRFVRLAEFILNDVFDLRDRTCLTPERAQRGTSNWQTDMCIGAAMIAAAVEEIPYRKQWMMNAEAVLSAQLEYNLNPDGSWPESLRYHHAALEHFCTFAIFWEQEIRGAWRCTETLNRMFHLSIGAQTPPYAYFDGRIGTPPFGDHRLSGGGEYQVLGLWIGIAAKTEPMLAAQMLETWERAGAPAYTYGTEAMAVENLMLADRVLLSLPEPDCRYRKSSRAFPDAGLYYFRRNEGSTCLVVMANEKRIGHGHRDQGSFVYYYDNVPLVMDGGIESYFDASTQWHISSYAHACLQFQTEESKVRESTEINLSGGGFSARKGWCDTPGTVRVLYYLMEEDKSGEKAETTGGKEEIALRITYPEGEHTRIIAMKSPEEVLVCDSVDGFEGEVLFSLPLVVKDAVLSAKEGAVTCTGISYYDVELTVESLLPVKRAWLEAGRVTAMHPGREEGREIPYLRMVADAKTGFEVRLTARKAGK